MTITHTKVHLKSYLEKVEKDNNKELTKTFDNINKWINDPHIDNKISNNFWTNPTIRDAQITLPKCQLFSM
jgi:hypothetical protein